VSQVRRFQVRNEDGVWSVVEPDGPAHVLLRSDRKREVVERARKLLREAGGGELVIESASGRIRETYRLGPGVK
jgi:fructoselysine-6-P-deglycase FrlB-like protein